MEEERTPDPQYHDRLMSQPYDTDEELHRVILQSRREYQEQEQQRRQKEHDKQQLRQRLAVPISRLTLWKNRSTHDDERECLHHILNLLYVRTHPDRDDDDACVPAGQVGRVRSFLDQHLRTPPLYQEAYQICMSCLS
jgi:hypothetical protein